MSTDLNKKYELQKLLLWYKEQLNQLRHQQLTTLKHYSNKNAKRQEHEALKKILEN